MRKLALGVALALVTAFPGVVAFHGAEEPLIGAVPFSGNHWAAWRIVLGATGNVDVEASATLVDAEVASVGTWLLNGDGTLRGALVATSLPATTDVFVQALGQAPTLDITQGGANGLMGAAITFNDVPAGEYIAVGLAAAKGGMTNGELALHASGGARLLAATDGREAFAVPSTDFPGTVNVHAAVPLAAQAMVIVEGAHQEVVQHKLFALYQKLSFNPFTPLTCTINYQGPNGGGAGTFIYFLHGTAAGTYNFRVPSCVDGGLGPFRAYIWAVGADVRLP